MASDVPKTPEDELEASRAPLLEHLIELRQRLLYAVIGFSIAFAICFSFAQEIYDFLMRPLAAAMQEHTGKRLIYTALQEVFVTHLKVGFFGALLLSFPIVAVQVWLFVAPGLYRHERFAFLPFLVATPVLFTMGACLAFFVVIPWAWNFFLFYGTGGEVLPIEFEGKVSEYLSLTMQLVFAFGVAFLLPVGLVLMARVGIISSDWLRRQRRYSIVLAFIMGAVLTPPDPISQLTLAIPIIGLYEISIWLAKLIEKRRPGAA